MLPWGLTSAFDRALELSFSFPVCSVFALQLTSEPVTAPLKLIRQRDAATCIQIVGGEVGRTEQRQTCQLLSLNDSSKGLVSRKMPGMVVPVPPLQTWDTENLRT